jgi:hypothetical protein
MRTIRVRIADLIPGNYLFAAAVHPTLGRGRYGRL